MEMKKNKKMNSEKMTVRDYITVAILFALMFLVHVIVGTPVGMTGIGHFFVYGVDALVWGTIYLLLYTKVNKNGVPLLFGMILAVLLLMTFWVIAAIVAIGAVVTEILWQKLDKRKFSTMLICFTSQTVFWYLAAHLPLIFIKDIYLAAMPSYAEFYSRVFELAIGPMFFIGLLGTIIGCVIGALIGKLLLKKHFQKAGIV